MDDCEYEFDKCNACDKAKECDKVEIWNSYHGKNIVAKAGTFDAIYNDTEEDYDYI